MNLFQTLYGWFFWLAVVYFVSDPRGFIRESEMVMRAPGPKIINGRLMLPKLKVKEKKKSLRP